jgi:hypothetical protein
MNCNLSLYRLVKFVGAMFILLVFAGCQKNWVDYRNKFIGDFTFRVHYETYGAVNPPIDTNYQCDGKIEYGYDKEAILIKVNDTTSFEPTLYEDGTLELDYPIQGNIIGSFESTTSIRFHVSFGGLGGGITYEIHGNRKK